MPHTDADRGPRIYYEIEGPVGGVPVVLIEGLSAQLIGWRVGFRKRLFDAGCRLVLLDNRDVGLSDKLGDPDEISIAYSIDDMADDVVRVLIAAELASAHVIGQSMGGAIAQSLALRHPTRVRSLTLLYTAPMFDTVFIGGAASERPAPAAGMDRAAAIEARVDGERACASPLYGFDEVWVRTAAALGYDRCPRIDGIARQREALAASPDRRPELRALSLPCAIIHGRGDAIVRWQAAIALADAIPGADLHLFAGLGHVVAEPLWPQFTAIIGGIVARGESTWRTQT